MISKRTALVWLLIIAPFTAHADIITLDNLPDDFRYQNLPHYVEGDFSVDVSCTDCVNVFSASHAWGSSGKFLETWNTYATFSISEVNGRNFSFTGLDIGWYDNDTSDAGWVFLAFDQSGSQVGGPVFTNGRGHFDLDFYDVNRVTIQQTFWGFSSFDNLTVTAVPEPGSLLLLGVGLVGIGVARKRKKSAT